MKVKGVEIQSKKAQPQVFRTQTAAAADGPKSRKIYGSGLLLKLPRTVRAQGLQISQVCQTMDLCEKRLQALVSRCPQKHQRTGSPNSKKSATARRRKDS